jgi:hypothetical protein
MRVDPREAPRSETLAYIAGIVDGEGTIIISKTTKKRYGLIAPTYVAWLRVGNTNERLIRFLDGTFKGSVITRRLPNPRHKRCYVWQLTGVRARDVLRLIRPYLVLKGQQADLVERYFLGFVSFMKAGRHGTLSPEQLAHREMCYQEMKALNQKGAPAETERGDTHMSVGVGA